MKAEDIIAGEDFQKCVEFHGHLCPGLTMGYKASVAGLEWLKAHRSVDEEIVAIVETDACCADAVQVMTGCTFGKGNFIFKDHGKMAFTFFNRKSGQCVRVVLKSDAFTPDKRNLELIQKKQTGIATDAELEEFKKQFEKRTRDILEKPVDDIFDLKEAQFDLPAKAQIQPSIPCSQCGEPTMESRLSEKDGLRICRGCSPALTDSMH
ncbi:MAG: FmdE family protein [Desulfobacterales bacterium]|jgi:formylmethanofuran dehydrogenase subunit E|nr:FmdE family protein [Desulfobacterales bacterium]